MIKLWKCCMSDEDGSATAFVMQWRWPIKYRHRHYSQLSVTFSWLTTRKTAFSRPWNGSRATLTGNSPVTVRTQHRAFLETTVGHFVDHWPLQQWSRSAHLVKTRARRPEATTPRWMKCNIRNAPIQSALVDVVHRCAVLWLCFQVKLLMSDGSPPEVLSLLNALNALSRPDTTGLLN